MEETQYEDQHAPALCHSDFSSLVDRAYPIASQKGEIAFAYTQEKVLSWHLGKFTSRFIPERKKRINPSNGTFAERIHSLTRMELSSSARRWCMVFNQYPFSEKHLLLCLKSSSRIRTDIPCSIAYPELIDDLANLVRDNHLPGVKIGLNAEGAGMSIPFFHCHVVQERLPVEAALWEPDGYWPASFRMYDLQDASHIRALKERINFLHRLKSLNGKISYNLVILAEAKTALLFPRKRDGSQLLADKTGTSVRRIGFMEVSGNFIQEREGFMTENLIGEVLREVSLSEGELEGVCRM